MLFIILIFYLILCISHQLDLFLLLIVKRVRYKEIYFKISKFNFFYVYFKLYSNHHLFNIYWGVFFSDLKLRSFKFIYKWHQILSLIFLRRQSSKYYELWFKIRLIHVISREFTKIYWKSNRQKNNKIYVNSRNP